MLKREHIEGVVHGDVGAFREVYDALAPRLLYYVHRLTGRRDVSQDIVHEAFVFLWENRARVADVIDLKAWLFAVAYNNTRNYLRGRGLRRRLLDGLDLPAEPDEQLMVAAEMCGEIRGVVAGLPARTRRVIELGMHGMSVAEVAAAMDVSVNTVKTLRKEGYRVLREKLGHLRVLFLW